MSRRAKNPNPVVAPVSSKKQLLDRKAVCQFLGGIGEDLLDEIRNDASRGFPPALQCVGKRPMWSVDQLEKFVARGEKEVEHLGLAA